MNQLSRYVIMTSAMVCCASPIDAQSTEALDRAEVERVVREAYVDVVYGTADVAQLRAGIHPGFHIYTLWDGSVTVRDRETWLERLMGNKANQNAEERPEPRADFVLIDVEGDAAVAKFDIYRGDELVYTDYLTLYRVDGSWKITSKHFAIHS